MKPVSLYLHVPFCLHRCGYCDFNTYAGLENLIDPYVDSLVKEIQYIHDSKKENVSIKTIYFGGGTPSLLSCQQLIKIINAIRDNFELLSDIEITLELNPGTVLESYFYELKEIGINRLSIGVQTPHPTELRILERIHDYFDVINAVKYARKAGINNLSLDLIFGLPNQTLSDWKRNLKEILLLKPNHVSLYGLTIEHHTPFEKLINRGILSLPDPDSSAEMFEYTIESMAEFGFRHYEISNWAANTQQVKDYRSQHNIQYWKNLPYIGLGAGAHGYIHGYRTANVLGPQAYIQRLQNGSFQPFPKTPATISAKKINRETEMAETMMMGLRLIEEGVAKQDFLQRFGQPLEKVYEKEIKKLVAQGLLKWGGENSDRLVLSRRGIMLGNVVFREFI